MTKKASEQQQNVQPVTETAKAAPKAKFSTVEQVKVNLTADAAKRTDKRGFEYVGFGIAKNTKNGSAFANASVYNKKVFEKAEALKKGDFVLLYGKSNVGKNGKNYFKVYDFKKFEKKAKPEAEVAPAAAEA